MTAGISKDGERVEAMFRDITGAEKVSEKAKGDALIRYQGGPDVYVEAKKASSNTINQVRAVKYLVLVVYDTRDESWYVVPADVVAKLCADKKRGQHGENPFENATLSVKKLGSYKLTRATKQTLRAKVRECYDAAQANSKVKRRMKAALTECSDLAAKHKKSFVDDLPVRARGE